ncbi:MAG: RNA-binding protein [Nanoarchaeota archaeon]
MKLHIGNLPFSIDEEAFKELFSGFNAQDITLIKDKFSGRSKGFGFVTIEDEEIAKKVISELNGKDVAGRELKVSEARPMEERPKRDFHRRSFGDRDDNRRRF